MKIVKKMFWFILTAIMAVFVLALACFSVGIILTWFSPAIVGTPTIIGKVIMYLLEGFMFVGISTITFYLLDFIHNIFESKVVYS